MHVDSEIEKLPHWARVAFAAHCARACIPLFRGAWPNALPRRLEALQIATQLAEDSAARATAAHGLKDAFTEAIMAAGVALYPTLGFPISEPVPSNKNECLIASSSAKASEWAAKAAYNGPSESSRATVEAFDFCRQAAEAAGAKRIVAELRLDFTGLCRVAAQGEWDDTTSVSPSIFVMITEVGMAKPWWRFW